MIGAGGLSQIYRGYNIFTRGAVAIKVLLPNNLRDEDAIALFRREAEILSTLHHEAIVRYYTYSYDPVLQREYLVMELVEGDSLKRRLAVSPLTLEETMQLKARIAGGLEAAHQRGIVHRDISPDNIMLPAGEVRSAKIIDFGIGKARDARNETVVRGGFAGKYLYASPEQVSSGDVTFKSDIYSFGLVLAEALRGRPIDMGGSIADVVDKRRRAPDLSDIDAKIRPLLQSMLQPSPKDRPASMAAVAAWPTRVKQGLGDAAGAPGPSAAAQGRGGRIAAAIGALVIAVSVGATAFVFRSDIADWFRNGQPKPTETTVASAPPAEAIKPPPVAPPSEAAAETPPAATSSEAIRPPQSAPLGTPLARHALSQPANGDTAGNVAVALAPPTQSVVTTAPPIAT